MIFLKIKENIIQALGNAEIKTYQDETTGKWHASAVNPKNGTVVIETNTLHKQQANGEMGGYDTEQEAIDALIVNYRRAIGG